MTGMIAQVNRIQNAAIDWQERRIRKSEERVQNANIHRQRMTCSDSLRFDTQSQDWISGMGVSPSGRFQVVEEAKPRRRIFSAEGIRWDAAWGIIIVIAVLCAAILLADLAGIGTGSRTITKLDSKITDVSEKNEQLRSELTYSAGDASVCTEAVKLNLISGNGVQKVMLTAPREANLTITAIAAWGGQ